MAIKISDLMSVRASNIARKVAVEAVAETPVMFAVVSREVGGRVKVAHRQLYLATLAELDVFQKAALVHAFPMAVSSDRKQMDAMGKEAKAELAAKTGLKGREWYWLSNVDGMEPSEAKKLGEAGKTIALNAVAYLHEATAAMLAEKAQQVADDGDVATQRVVVIRDTEAGVALPVEELLLG